MLVKIQINFVLALQTKLQLREQSLGKEGILQKKKYLFILKTARQD
jgi:hypothetical protein